MIRVLFYILYISTYISIYTYIHIHTFYQPCLNIASLSCAEGVTDMFEGVALAHHVPETPHISMRLKSVECHARSAARLGGSRGGLSRLLLRSFLHWQNVLLAASVCLMTQSRRRPAASRLALCLRTRFQAQAAWASRGLTGAQTPTRCCAPAVVVGGFGRWCWAAGIQPARVRA